MPRASRVAAGDRESGNAAAALLRLREQGQRGLAPGGLLRSIRRAGADGIGAAQLDQCAADRRTEAGQHAPHAAQVIRNGPAVHRDELRDEFRRRAVIAQAAQNLLRDGGPGGRVAVEMADEIFIEEKCRRLSGIVQQCRQPERLLGGTPSTTASVCVQTSRV